MSNSLKIAADSVTDTMYQVTATATAALADSVDWVQECAYRQAMLIDRIDVWMTFIQGAFFAGIGTYLIIWVVGLTIKKKPSA